MKSLPALPALPALSRTRLPRILSPRYLRHSSTTTNPPPKPRVLAKPDRFNPPSHPSRLRTRPPPKYYGPALTPEELAAQKTKKYPHMMPPEGTFMYWFLTNRSIHVYITIGILVTLTGGIWLTEFLRTTPYRAMLPPNSLLWEHPITFLRQWWDVFEMHVAYTTAQTAERRRLKTEDVRKRAEYRKAHGLEEAGEGVLGGWTVKGEGRTEGADDDGTYVDFEGNRQPIPERKKWLGIF